MSRNIEVISEIVEESISRPCTGIENLASRIVRKVKERHEYARYAEVHLKADYFLERKTPLGRKTVERYKLLGSARMDENGVKKMVGVEVVGMTACPCAMETVRAMLRERLDDEIIEKIPVPTHNQRFSGRIRVPGGISSLREPTELTAMMFFISSIWKAMIFA